MQIHISDEIALNRAENIAQSAVLLALPFLMPECQLLHLVSCCFYRTHQVLVDLKGCELQGQLHSLSVRVREWGICRSSQGYGQWVLHRLSGVVVWGELNGWKVLSIPEIEMEWKIWYFGSGVNGLKGWARGREWKWLLSFWDSSLWLCVWVCQHTTVLPLAAPLTCCLKAPCKVSEGQMQSNWIASTELLVLASLNSSSNCWHCDLEPLMLKESFLLTATVGGGGRRREGTMSQEICLKACLKQQTTSQGSGQLNCKRAHTDCWGLKMMV